MNITRDRLEKMLNEAFEKAKKGYSKKTNSKRSSDWVEALAEQFRKNSKDNDIRVFSKGCYENRSVFKVNEYLYDITVIRTNEVKSVNGHSLEYPEETLWHVESEFASNNSRESIVDFGKLLMSSAENKLMILPSGRRIEDWAREDLHKIACSKNYSTVYFAFVPHPRRWGDKFEKAVTVEKVPGDK